MSSVSAAGQGSALRSRSASRNTAPKQVVAIGNLAGGREMKIASSVSAGNLPMLRPIPHTISGYGPGKVHGRIEKV